MAYTAAYSGMRWGELAALTISQVDQAARVIAVDRKVIEVGGHLYLEAPKGRKSRRTIYPRCTPVGYPLAERLGVRIEQVRAEERACDQPTRPHLPFADGEDMAILQLQPHCPQARVP
jgi:integrase